MSNYKDIRLLYYSLLYAPNNVVGAFRVIKFVKYFDRLGITQFIFTSQTDINVNSELNKEIPNGLKIYRKKNKLITVNTLAAQNVKSNFINRSIYLVKDLFFSPDKYIWWSLSLIFKMISVIKKNQINVIMICGDPFSLFINGYLLKKILKKPLILDYRDPWRNNVINLQQSFIRRFFDTFWERICTRNADLIITTTDQIAEDLAVFKPKGRVVKLTNGFDLEDFNFSINKNDDKFTFLYTGKYSIKYDDYNPKSVIEAYKNFIEKTEVSNCQLIFTGATDKETLSMIKNFGIKSIICHGIKTKNEVALMQKKADILVHYFYPVFHKDIISLKVFEYAICEKPIISFNICKGALYEFIKDNQLGETTSNNDINKMADLFERAYLGKINVPVNSYKKLKDFDIKNISQKLADYMLELIADNEKK